MKMLKKVKDVIPTPVKEFLLPIRRLTSNKYSSELSYWKKKLEIENGVFQNYWYKRLMLARLSGFAGYFSRNPCKINPTIAKVFTTGSFVPRRPEPSHGGAADGAMTGATA